jgi:hypothetical protein
VKTKLHMVFLAGLLLMVAVACNPFDHQSDVVSRNLSTAADQFEVLRRVVFYNGITDSYMLTIEGYCALGNNDSAGQLTVTCKVGGDEYKKHFLGLSDNVTYFVEQLDAKDVSPDHYRVVFKPSVIVPDIDIP